MKSLTASTGKRKRRVWYWIKRIILGFFLLAVFTLVLSAISNRFRPTQSEIVTILTEAEKARAAETIHLRQTLGDSVWEGWGSADIPLILYNEAYAFLLNYPFDPPDGWLTVPDKQPLGTAWEVVPDDTFNGDPYYRQPLNSGVTPQAFTVLIGDQWVASMATKEWMEIGLANNIQDQLPNFLQPIFPYQLFVNQLVNSSDHYIALVLHESFHAYQGIMAFEQLANAENITHIESTYPWEAEATIAAWQAELEILTGALRADDQAEREEWVQQFLHQREMRRLDTGISAEMIAYEQKREWLEGAAKYVEIEIWRAAFAEANYMSMITSDSDFDDYATFERQWQRELSQMERTATDESGIRFYYSGWAQAALLDQLLPTWKDTYWTTDTTLELLLKMAIEEET